VLVAVFQNLVSPLVRWCVLAVARPAREKATRRARLHR
jgi:hypothetical protein